MEGGASGGLLKAAAQDVIRFTGHRQRWPGDDVGAGEESERRRLVRAFGMNNKTQMDMRAGVEAEPKGVGTEARQMATDEGSWLREEGEWGNG